MICIEYTSDETTSVEGYGELSKGIKKCWPDEVAQPLIDEGKAKQIPSLREVPDEGQKAQE